MLKKKDIWFDWEEVFNATKAEHVGEENFKELIG